MLPELTKLILASTPLKQFWALARRILICSGNGTPIKQRITQVRIVYYKNIWYSALYKYFKKQSQSKDS